MDEEGGASGGGGGAGKIIAVVLIAVIAAAAYFLMSGDEEEEKKEEDVPVIHEAPPPLEKPMYLPLGSFVVNLTDGKYFLKSSITLAFTEPMAHAWLSTRLPIVKDMIITQFGALSTRKLKQARVREIVKQDLKNKINSLFPNNPGWEDRKPVKKILFEEFYTQ